MRSSLIPRSHRGVMDRQDWQRPAVGSISVTTNANVPTKHVDTNTKIEGGSSDDSSDSGSSKSPPPPPPPKRARIHFDKEEMDEIQASNRSRKILRWGVVVVVGLAIVRIVARA